MAADADGGTDPLLDKLRRATTQTADGGGTAAATPPSAPLPERIDASPESAQRGLAALVLTLVDTLRELLERQAVRRMEGGTLTDDEIERLGQTFMALSERMDELKVAFDLDDEDLNLDLGPLGRLR